MKKLIKNGLTFSGLTIGGCEMKSAQTLFLNFISAWSCRQFIKEQICRIIIQLHFVFDTLKYKIESRNLLRHVLESNLW